MGRLVLGGGGDGEGIIRPRVEHEIALCDSVSLVSGKACCRRVRLSPSHEAPAGHNDDGTL